MTNESANTRDEIEALQRLLEGHGADRSRWPARERLRFTSLLAESREARRVLAEAEALDALLDTASEPSPAEISALSARIAAAAGREPVRPAARVRSVQRNPLRADRPAQREIFNWPAAALLAASLVIGVFAGSADFVEMPGSAPTVVASLENDAEGDASQLALGGDTTGLGEEDLL